MSYNFAVFDPRPQGVSSKLTIDEVVAVIEKHLLV